MKNKLNIILLISFLLALSLTIWVYYQGTNRVGDISFNSEVDKATFKVCNEKLITQYYNFKSIYQGGKRAVKNEIQKTIEHLTFKSSGFITFRFIMNCNGEIGRFRVKTIDNKLKTIDFDPQKIKTLKERIERLKNWKAGMRKNKTFDSYVVLSFKIEKGKITDVF